MHIYAFGSICRGDIDVNSDIDLLAITKGFDKRFEPNTFSIYSYLRISELWKEGNPFAWHLFTEVKLVYSVDESDYIKSLGSPQKYNNCKRDCYKFYNLFISASSSITSNSHSKIFELSTIFLAIRNFATCYLLGKKNIKDFSRNSALHLNGSALEISDSTYKILEQARIISTRGVGKIIPKEEIIIAIEEIAIIKKWMEELLKEVNQNG